MSSPIVLYRVVSGHIISYHIVSYSIVSLQSISIMRVEVEVCDIESGDKFESNTRYPSGISSNINNGTYDLTFVPYAIAHGFVAFDENAAASSHAFITDIVDAAPNRTVRFKCFYDREYVGEWVTECTFEQAGIRIELHFDGRE